MSSSFLHCPAYEYTNQKPLVSVWFGPGSYNAEHSTSTSAPSQLGSLKNSQIYDVHLNFRALNVKFATLCEV